MRVAILLTWRPLRCPRTPQAPPVVLGHGSPASGLGSDGGQLTDAGVPLRVAHISPNQAIPVVCLPLGHLRWPPMQTERFTPACLRRPFYVHSAKTQVNSLGLPFL